MSAGPERRRSLLRAVLIAAVATAVAAVLLVVLVGNDEDDGASGDGTALAGPDEAPFRLVYPDTWEAVPAAALGSAEPTPVAGIRRTAGDGLITVTVRGPVAGGVERLRRALPAELRRRVPDFRLVESRVVEVAAGRAVQTTYVRERRGRLHTTLVVPDGGRSFRADAVLPADAGEAAREVGAIYRTFDVRG